MAEVDFVRQIERDLKGEFWVEHVEQRHTRGFPDLVLLDLADELMFVLIEVKISLPIDILNRDITPVVIKSLKPHQINWLESRCKVGGVTRPGVGMLLLIEPMIFYIRGDKVARWREKPAPTYNEVVELSTFSNYMFLSPSALRKAINGK